ncbi:MAG: polysaccharide pyruvyl transferase family protein [Chitinispirillaceae bacterium]|nr:polysaccharide pyruvyl transferase family protein [Chitinispirillaceae bacterium]
MKNVNLCILGASPGTNNLGVGVLLSGLVKCARHQFPGAEISVLDYGRKSDTFVCLTGTERVPVRLINMRFSIKLFQWNNIVVLLALAFAAGTLPRILRNAVIRRNAVLRDIAGMDIVGSIAGGDSFSDIYGMEQFLYVTLPQLLVLFLGKKLVQFPQTYGPYKRHLARTLAGYLLSRSGPVFSRDHAGVALVNKMTPSRKTPGDVRFLPDVGFVLDPLPATDPATIALTRRMKGGGTTVGVNISGLLYMGGYSRDNMFDLRFDYAAFVERLVKRFIDVHHTRVVLVPHVFGKVESDLEASSALYDRLAPASNGLLDLSSSPLNHHEVKQVIGACDFFIGSRMHACIAALSQGIPAAGLAYSKKFHGVMSSIGAEALVVDPCILSSDECLERIEELFSGRDAFAQKLKNAMPPVQREVLSLFTVLSGTLHR